jgi:hypothetical protein
MQNKHELGLTLDLSDSLHNYGTVKDAPPIGDYLGRNNDPKNPKI